MIYTIWSPENGVARDQGTLFASDRVADLPSQATVSSWSCRTIINSSVLID
jgi:hypothetical protein